MPTRWMTLAALATLVAVPAAAQRTADQARLSLGLSAGATTGTSLWRITGQPIIGSSVEIDTVNIGRKSKSSLAVVFHGTYFPGDHWGFTGEAMLVGLGFEDTCEISFSSGSANNAEICNSINGNDSPGSAVSLSVGTLYRVWSQRIISPYARVNAGLVISQHSSVDTEGSFTGDSAEAVAFRVYADPSRRQVSPVLGLGVGFTAALGRGYQLRWELRDNIIGVDQVTGPTFGSPNLEPPHEIAYKHVWSVTFGFDVLLERRRGRRY
jgi:Outer membrane protein beta-barrel domain